MADDHGGRPPLLPPEADCLCLHTLSNHPPSTTPQVSIEQKAIKCRNCLVKHFQIQEKPMCTQQQTRKITKLLTRLFMLDWKAYMVCNPTNCIFEYYLNLMSDLPSTPPELWEKFLKKLTPNKQVNWLIYEISYTFPLTLEEFTGMYNRCETPDPDYFYLNPPTFAASTNSLTGTSHSIALTQL